MAEQGLTRAMATAIVNCVATDADSRALIPEYSVWSIGQNTAGSLRNLTNMTAMGISNLIDDAAGKLGGSSFTATARDYWDRQGNTQACTGIANATSAAITKAIRRGSLPSGIVSSDPVTRRPQPDNKVLADHDATGVTVVSGQTYVFDWHGPLSLRNPLISRRLAAWQRGDDEMRVLYSIFRGWG